MTDNTRRLALLLAALTAAFHLSCGGKKAGPTPPGGSGIPAKPGNDLVLVQDGNTPDGLAIRLSDGEGTADRPVQVKQADATAISEAAAEALLRRMQPLVAAGDDKKDFALRDRSQPPPRTGKTVNDAFPPPVPAPGTPPAVDPTDKDLRVVRWAPEGDVPLAPHLSITFSQPMVAVTSHTDSVKAGVPVTITPEPPGNWRWIGTRTLLFDPEVRFPQATEYRVEIPAGTRAATGQVLKEAKRFTFTTPAPRLQSSWPSGRPHRRDEVMFALFDQRIDQQAVRSSIAVKAGKRTHTVREPTAEELAAAPQVKAMIDAAEQNGQGDRWVAFRAAELLPADARIQVVIGAGTPSAEGPRTTSSPQSWTFHTYGPLQVEESRCTYGRDCPPMAPWYIRFSNPLDAEAFDPASIRIEPALPGYKAEQHGAYLYIRGMSEGRTTYQVTLPAALTDTFGQTLGKDTTLTFKVGDAQPRLWAQQGLIVADPAARTPSYDLFTINFDKLKVRLYQVEPGDWGAYVEHMRNQNRRNPTPPPGKKVVDTTMSLDDARDKMVETHIDLTPALTDGLGHVLVDIEPMPWPHSHAPPRLRAWVQVTRIGLDAFVDDTELVAWATRLSDGRAIEGAALEIAPYGITGSTNAKGVARIALASKQQEGSDMLVARRGSDVAFLPESNYYWSNHGGWYARTRSDHLSWYLADDRKMYRPGETVHLKGWIRRIGAGEGGDLGAVGDTVSQVKYKVVGPRGNDLKEGKAKVTGLGGFDFEIELPDTPNLGWARIELTADGRGAVEGRNHYHSFQIQEFRRPEFEVTATASQGPHIVGEHADVTVSAAYYAGGGLPNAEVNWNVVARPGSFVPPNRDEFTFGTWVPWWGYRHHGPDMQTTSFQHQSKTDATGKHVLRLDFLSVKPPRPMQVTANATVTDVNRQAWTAAATMLVHPSDLYLGLKSERLFVEQGQPLEVDAIVVDHDGKAVVGREMRLRAVRLDWTWKNGEYKETEEDPQSCEPISAADALTCEFSTDRGGTYRITGTVIDDAGRRNQTQLTLWVSGGERPPARTVEQEEIMLVPDKKEYAAGDTAQLLVQAPFYPAEGLLTVRRSGIADVRRFDMAGPTTMLEVPIADSHTPNLHVQVDLVGSAPRTDDQGKPANDLPRRPAYAVGSVELAVPPLLRTLALEVTPRDRKLAPGADTAIAVQVRDALGRPVSGAEVAIVVVDEAVLSLTGYSLPNPLDSFYQQRGPGTRDHHLRSMVALARPDDQALDGETDADAVLDGAKVNDLSSGSGRGDMAEAEAAPAPPSALSRRTRSANGKSAAQQAPQPIAARTNFAALATFAPAVETDARGRATVKLKIPDNLTRYRVMVVAAAGERDFGAAESSITARMPLMVRPSPPRFLNFGDTFELPIVLQNQTDQPMQVEVAVRATNLGLTAGSGRRLTVPANDRREVRFPAAAEMPGIARFQVAASSGQWADGAELALPVWTPATTEAFATYGEIDSGAIAQPVSLPEAVVERYGGLEITTSSTQLQALTDAFLYLVSYPYEASAQRASRVMAVAALRDVLTAFDAEGLPPVSEIVAAVERDLQALEGMQNYDGGWGFWYRGQESWPYLTVHVSHALARAEAKGFAVPTRMKQSAHRYLKQIESRIPSWYPAEVRRSLIAYALYVRKHLGDVDATRARGLIAEAGLEGLSMEAIGWLLHVMTGDADSGAELKKLRRHLSNRATETAATAAFATSYSDGAHLLLHSDRRVDGVILEALIEDSPKSDLIPKIVRGLLAHRTRGRWSNTQDNAFVLLALDRYFQEYEKVTPNFVARAWLGDQFAGQHRFKGRTTESHQIDIPMAYLARIGKADLVLEKKGKGRLYYRIGMTYAPESLQLSPADHGFAVERLYEAVDDPGDVRQKKDGTWVVKAGARVRVRLTMVAESRRYHVALVDPLPAGLEPLNPDLAVTGPIPADPKQQKNSGPYWWWMRPWYEHQNVRDERVEAFTSLLWEGVHEYSYVTRATTPGRFVVPPTKAEEMYFPETFGRSASAVVVVE